MTTSTITRHYWHLFTAVRNAFIFISHKRNSITSAQVFGKIEKPIHASLAHAGHLQKAHIYMFLVHTDSFRQTPICAHSTQRVKKTYVFTYKPAYTSVRTHRIREMKTFGSSSTHVVNVPNIVNRSICSLYVSTTISLQRTTMWRTLKYRPCTLYEISVRCESSSQKRHTVRSEMTAGPKANSSSEATNPNTRVTDGKKLLPCPVATREVKARLSWSISPPTHKGQSSTRQGRNDYFLTRVSRLMRREYQIVEGEASQYEG